MRAKNRGPLRFAPQLPWLCALVGALGLSIPVWAVPDTFHSRPGGDQWLERVRSGFDRTIPGEVRTPYPTIHNLAVEWMIDGDDNLDGVVSVRFRATGQSAWRDAMPLRRVPAMVFKDEEERRPFWPWENKHSGSILDLEPDTEYEIALHLVDPDGGDARRTVRARTRPVPSAMPGAPVKRVTPETFADVYAGAEPGDILLLAPGHYGQFFATKDGEPGRPLVIRADPRHPGIKEGPGERGGYPAESIFTWVSLEGRKHVHVEGIVSTGSIVLFDAEDCAVMRCRVYAVWGIVSGWSQKWARWAETQVSHDPWKDEDRWVSREAPREEIPPYSKNCYIADNTVIGITRWTLESMGARGKNLGEGIEINGPGNVICHNLVIGFRDSISLMEGQKMYEQICVDIYNNDVYAGADDGIEVDYMMSNCRVMRNRISNSMRGIAAAPSLGGPNYIIRNVLYNVRDTWQLGRVGAGYVVLHNTVVKHGPGVRFEPHLNSLLRNNLFIAGGENAMAIETSRELAASVDSNFNGYGVVGGPFGGRLGKATFDSQATLRERTMEVNSVEAGLNVFAGEVRVPKGLFPELIPPDLRLRPGSAAIDAGEVIANVNDDFTGRAPDLGAHELGRPVPIYGPRPE